MERRSTYYMKTGNLTPVDFPARETAEQFTSTWEDLLEEYLYELREWLYEPAHIHDTLASVENTLIEKHHDYGEDNLRTFGELGILVRAADKIARLKNLAERCTRGEQPVVKDENREDTWLDLAGYAVQALIMIKMAKDTEKADIFEIRKNRLIRGQCPDCGEGVLLRSSFWENRLHCSAKCGFATGDLYAIHLNYPDFTAMIDFLASQQVYTEQR